MTLHAVEAPMVTIFADHGPLVARIADEIRDRGASTHTVSVEAGWLASVSRALVVVDSPAGLSAVRELCEIDAVPARVVALFTGRALAEAEDLCDRCVDRHRMTLMRSSDDNLLDRVADELVGQHGR